jgi:hypothetical protein
MQSAQKRILRTKFFPALLFSTACLSVTHGVHAEAEVLPPDAVVAGRSIGEWTGAWWQAALEAVDFPFAAGGIQPGALGDVGGPVFFAVASPPPADTPTTYLYTLPRNQYVLMPLYTYTWVVQQPDDPCSDFECARALANRFVRATMQLSVTVDGRPVRNLFRHHATTPRPYNATVPTDGWFAAPDGQYAGLWYGAASGYWLMLEPLDPGMHVVKVSVTAPYSSVCANNAETCDIPEPGDPQLSESTLILNVPCNARRGDRGDRGERCGTDRRH